ncbi:ATP-binding protein [Streptomyces sp. RFCAC02]|uniref:ATP-binding protein n=1 Tax=Streptomyces sp. RFCAC02 TaxID=2499143 RepID=UPI001021B1E2|nr:ATP-binding protein [Streptomyces sp. RFCAC02]
MTVPVQIAERHVFAWDLLAAFRQVETWRRTVSLVLGDWDASPDAIEVARLGVSELLTNVARHAGDPWCRLRVARRDGQVGVAVRDRSPVLPVVREPDWDSDCGRGLWLLREMCQDFGCRPVARGGKTVWFVVPLVPEAAEAVV